MIKKIVEYGPETVKKFLRGVEVVDQMVGSTIGHCGSNKIIQRKYAAPQITNDGVTIARNIYLEDEVEDLAAQTLVEIAMKTNDLAGDGTTSAVVGGSALIRSSFKRLKEANENSDMGGGSLAPIQLARQIEKAVPEAIALLKEQKVDLTDEFLTDVISTSLENLEYGKTLGELLKVVGKDGYISVDDNWLTKYGIDTETIMGMKFLGSYASPFFATESNRKEAIWTDTQILVTNHRIEHTSQIKKLIDQMKKENKKKLVIIGGFVRGGNPFSDATIMRISQNMEAFAVGKTDFQILLVKAPTLTSPELEDVAVFCNAKFIDVSIGMALESVEAIHLGSAQKIAVSEDDVNIIGGAGNTEERIKVLKEQIEREKDPMFEEKTKKRIASLASAVGIIRVGAATEPERTYLKGKIEDAVNAARAAMEEGVVEGAGIALKKVADKLGKDHVLYDALMAPYLRIRLNAGEDDLVVPANIRDALKVVRVGFENACSAAAKLITCDGAIAERRESLFDVWEKKMVPHDARDDFRDPENQDLGRSSRR